MGAGKSTIGKQLARSLNLQFVDSDREIESAAGVDIATIFEFEGEAGFRKREAAAIDEILLTKSGTPRSFNRYPSKAIHDVFPDLRADLQARLADHAHMRIEC